jgi:hypothetical protein
MLGQIVYSSYYRGVAYLDGTDKTFLYLNGQVVSRSSYPYLDPYFPVGTYGSTLTNIVLPDLTGAYWRGVDLNRGADVGIATRTLPSGTLPAGSGLGTYQDASMLNHTHSLGSFGSIAATTGGGTYFGNSANRTGKNSVGTIPIASGITCTGVLGSDFDVASMTYFPYLGVD